jgi:hypothetical protein
VAVVLTKELMRHEKLDTTQRYDYRPDTDVRQVADLFSLPAWGGPKPLDRQFHEKRRCKSPVWGVVTLSLDVFNWPRLGKG